MLTLALYGLLAVVLIGGLFLIAARVLPAGEQIAPPVRDEPVWELPDERALVAADIADVRLPVALRGYRFEETDLLLDRLVEELRTRDEEISRLRGAPQAAGVRTPQAPQGEERSESGTPSEARSPDETAPEHLSGAGQTPDPEDDPGPAGSAAHAGSPEPDDVAAPGAGSPGPDVPATRAAVVPLHEHGGHGG